MKIKIEIDGTWKEIEVSEESYNELKEAVKEPKFEITNKDIEFFKIRAGTMFSGWNLCKWLNNENSEKELTIYLAQLYWKSQMDADFEPDWDNYNQKKYSIYFDSGNKKYKTDFWFWSNYGMQVWFSSKEKAKQCIKDLKRLNII